MAEPLRRPPAYSLLAGFFLVTAGAITGMVLIALQDWLYAWARAEIIRRPDVHGFAGAEVIDAARIAEVADQSNAALRMFHTHSLETGILILVAAIVIANLPISPRLQGLFSGLVSAGAVLPLGWLLLAWLIPFWGVDRLHSWVQWLLFLPFGGALMVGLCGAFGWYLMSLARKLFAGSK